MSEYTYNKTCEPDSLQTEIKADTAIDAKYTGMTTDGDPGTSRSIKVYTSSALAAGEETDLTDIVNAHTE